MAPRHRLALRFGILLRRPQQDGHLVHEAGVVTGGEQGCRRGHGIQQRLQPLLVGGGEIAQHMAGHQLLVAGMADADPDPAKIPGAQVLGDRAQAVVAGDPATGLDPQLAGREVELVMDHHQVLQGQLVKAHRLRHRIARAVDVGLRLLQQHLGGAQGALADQARESASPAAKTVAARDRVERHEAQVVAVTGVAWLGITEPHQQQHRWSSRAGLAGSARPRRSRETSDADSKVPAGPYWSSPSGASAASSLLLALLALFGLLHGDRRGRDGRHREIAIGDRGLDTLGHGHLRDVQAVADIRRGQIELELGRNRVPPGRSPRSRAGPR